MKEEFYKGLCMECIGEEVKEMSNAHLDGIMNAALIICMTSVLQRLEKKLKEKGFIS